MCIPPSYADLGKAARDVFNKGFGFGLVKLDVKTKSCSGVEFSTSGSSNTDTGKVTGTLETKYKWCEYGLTFTEKWNTDNTLGTEIAIEDQVTFQKCCSIFSFVFQKGNKTEHKLLFSSKIDLSRFETYI
jgi:voltage-dependent anion channel protein 2